MIRVHVFVEGQTEETFVRELLYEYFMKQDICLNPILVRTSRTGKGGVVSYAKIKSQLNRKCHEDRTAFVTTMFDFFRLPGDFPGMDSLPNTADSFKKAAHLEKQLADDIGHSNFLPNLLVHEFESILYSDTQGFSEWFGNKAVEHLRNERLQFKTPEHIDDGPDTAPSKRIARCCIGYEKPLHGSLIAMEIGLDMIRRECSHFNAWLTHMARLKGGRQR